MSRVGKMPVEIPNGVTVKVSPVNVVVTGPKGSQTVVIPTNFEVKQSANLLNVTMKTNETKLGNVHGLVRALLQQAVTGVVKGWEKTVELIGVGYKVSGGGQEVTLSVGFTHPVKVVAPAGIVFAISDNTKITVSGADKKMVGEIAAKLRAIKPPEPYKGKGIRYLGEIVRKKAGKAVKAAGAPA